MGIAPFNVRVEPGKSATTIALSGDLDIDTLAILNEHLIRVEADGIATVVVDLVELTFIESMSLHAFVAARDRAAANGRQLLFFGAQPPVRRVFELTGTESLLQNENVAVLFS